LVGVPIGVSVRCGLIWFPFLECLVNQAGWVAIGFKDCFQMYYFRLLVVMVADIVCPVPQTGDDPGLSTWVVMIRCSSLVSMLLITSPIIII